MVVLPLLTVAVIVKFTTAASSIFLSSIVSVVLLMLTTDPSTRRSPIILASPSTVKSFGVVTLKEESPLIHVPVPDPITSCLSPAAAGGE